MPLFTSLDSCYNIRKGGQPRNEAKRAGFGRWCQRP